jgi:hypothetical protein
MASVKMPVENYLAWFLTMLGGEGGDHWLLEKIESL